MGRHSKKTTQRNNAHTQQPALQPMNLRSPHGMPVPDHFSPVNEWPDPSSQFIWFISFVWFISLNQTNETNQITIF
jgi:hypothetical protein